VTTFPEALSPIDQQPVEILSILKACIYNANKDIQSTAVQGFSKLFLFKLSTDLETLGGLMLLYYHPSTSGNQKLRQCLNFLLQVLAYSSHENQQMIGQLFVSTLRDLTTLHRSITEKDTMAASDSTAD